MILQIIGAFVGTLLFAVVFNTSKNELFFCGLTGALGWAVYLLSFHFIHGTVVSSFFASFVISLAAQVLARVRKNPVTVFQIAGIFPLVPGAGMYQTLYYVVNEDYNQSIQSFFITLEIAGSIAIGMVLVSSINRLIFHNVITEQAR